MTSQSAQTGVDGIKVVDGGSFFAMSVRANLRKSTFCLASSRPVHQAGESTKSSDVSKIRFRIACVTSSGGRPLRDFTSSEAFLGAACSQLNNAHPPSPQGNTLKVNQSCRETSNARPVKVTTGRNVVATNTVGFLLKKTAYVLAAC